MKTSWPGLVLLPALVLSILLASCAGLGSSGTINTLTAAGFKPRTPQNEEQQAIYDQMEPYKLYNKMVRGKMLYAYKDPEQGVVYIGGDAENERYQQYAMQKQIARDQRVAAEMAWDARWSAWGPYQPWWY